MSAEKIIRAGLESFDGLKPGAFYGSADGLSLGCGLIFSGIPIPYFNSDERQFEILDSLVLVITHECDVANERAFNDHVLVCPIIPMLLFAETYEREHGYDSALNLTKEIAKNTVHRVFYLPPPADILGDMGALADGGLVYLNRITAANVSFFGESPGPICALSNYGLDRFDRKLTNHLLRPKSETLPITA
ncbi:MAG: hypothetical protein EOS41_12305 [Mesorhizobium sp.]|uniref:hypothetical protein n=1 Tax=Mesorhizobium sp. TaxID=1871066 RepID=UPI000FE4B16B|nr:hypothetical protein [Mesorhizobium sp.]RWE25223.1 MAG: hypothetical protein EOS41_12305 [Mesorhizobium sp.]